VADADVARGRRWHARRACRMVVEYRQALVWTERDKVEPSRISSVEGWRADAIDLSLTGDDLGLIDMVLCVDPELRIVAFIGQGARQRGLSYPVESADQLTEVIGGDSFELSGHHIDARNVLRALAPEWFPLSHEGEFLSAVKLGLARCRTEAVRERLQNIDRRHPEG
jgi:hypothetical protein